MNKKSSPVVFVVHESMSMNYSDAERFGEVRFVTNREWNPRRGSLSNGDTFRQIREGMKAFEVGHDYLVLNGPPVVLGYAFHIAMAAAERDQSGVRILSWDKRANKYIEGLAEADRG